MKKKILYITLSWIMVLSSCNNGEGETVESSYMIPLQQVPPYSFSRNETSSVDQWECLLQQNAVTYLYRSFLQKAYAADEDSRRRMREAYREGLNGAFLQNNVAEGYAYRTTVLKDIDRLLDATETLAGQEIHRQEASMGIPGYIGYNIGDDSRSYAMADGLIPAEIFKSMMIGCIYLNKVMNVHLDEGIFNNEDKRNWHRDVILPQGKNYTELEHHWDLAYGYFKNMQDLVNSENLPLLKNRGQKLQEAFAWGREALGREDYLLVNEKMKFIRGDLSQVVAVRAIHLLIGPNTLANLRSNTPQFAFYFISQAYGLIYGLQFTRKADGSPYLTYQDTQRLLALFTLGKGLWDTDRLQGGPDIEGSLLNIANSVGDIYGIKVEEIMR